MGLLITEDVEVAGSVLPKGTTVLCDMAAANRDEIAFDQAGGLHEERGILLRTAGRVCERRRTGPVMTNIEGSMRSDFAASRVGPVMQATMPRPVGPDVAASTIAWLLSDEAVNINGALLPCDGGWSVA